MELGTILSLIAISSISLALRKFGVDLLSMYDTRCSGNSLSESDKKEYVNKIWSLLSKYKQQIFEFVIKYIKL